MDLLNRIPDSERWRWPNVPPVIWAWIDDLRSLVGSHGKQVLSDDRVGTERSAKETQPLADSQDEITRLGVAYEIVKEECGKANKRAEAADAHLAQVIGELDHERQLVEHHACRAEALQAENSELRGEITLAESALQRPQEST